MATPFALPGLDQENEALKARLAYADALRNKSINTQGQMVDGIYVPKNPWENFAEAFGGSAMRGYHEAERTRADQGRAAEEQSWLNKMPGAQETKNYELAPGLAGPVGSETVTRTPEQMLSAQQSWVQQAPSSSQIGNAARANVLTQALNAPYKAMEREDVQAARLEQARAQAEARMDQIREAEAQRRITREEADMRARETKREFMHLAAALKSSGGGGDGGKPKMAFVDTVDEEGNAVKQAVDMNALSVGQQFGKPLTVAQRKDKLLVEAPSRIESIEKEAEKYPEAFGIVPAVASMLPNVIGSRITSERLTPDEQVARQKVMREAAIVIHDVYGAALSRGEAARANAWAPNPNDDYKSIMTKLRMAKDYAKSIAPAGKGSAAPAAPAPARKVFNPATGKLE